MNLIAGPFFAAIAFAAGILLIVFRTQFSSASARIQTRYYGALGRRTAKSSTPRTAAFVGATFIAFGVLFLLLGFGH